MNKEHYLNYAVWNKFTNGKVQPILIKAETGYFASKAWTVSDEAYGDVAGTKFGAIFGDDATDSWVSKFNVRRLASDEEFEQLYEASCLNFKILLKVLDTLCNMQKQLIETQARILAYQRTAEFKLYAAGWFDSMKFDKMPDDDVIRKIAECILYSH